MKRIGIHIVGNGLTPRLRQALERATPYAVFFTDPDLGTVEGVRQAVGDRPVTLVARLVTPDLTLARGTLTPSRARALANRCIVKAREIGVDIWQPANEPLTGVDPSRPSTIAQHEREMEALGLFDRAFGQAMRDAGLSATTSAFGSGKPYFGQDGVDMHWLQIYLDQQPLEVCDYWNIHQYWHLGMVNRGVPYHVGRWERAWPVFSASAQAQKKILLSELGWEVVSGRQGWRGFVPLDVYKAKLEALCDSLPLSFAACLFALPGSDPRWKTYDVSDLLPWLQEKWADNEHGMWQPTKEERDVVDDLDTYHALMQSHLEEIGTPYADVIASFPDKPDSWFAGRWTGSGSWFKPQSAEDITHYVLHHSAGDPWQWTGEVYRDRGEDLGGFPYHLAIYCVPREDGTIFENVLAVRTPYRWGAHVAGFNQDKIGILWFGRYDLQPPPAPALARFRVIFRAVRKALDEWCRHAPAVVGHRQIALPGHATVCPGGSWVEPFMAEMNSRRPIEEDPLWRLGYDAGVADGQSFGRRDAYDAVSRWSQEQVERWRAENAG